MTRFWRWLRRQKKETIAASVTLLVLVAAGAVVLIGASRLQGIFDPKKFERFGNRQEGESYDSVAGDGLESDLADWNRDGNSGNDKDGQKAVKTEGMKPQKLTKSDDDEGIGRTMGDDETAEAPEPDENRERNPDAYEITDYIGSRDENSISKPADENSGRSESTGESSGTQREPGSSGNGAVPGVGPTAGPGFGAPYSPEPTTAPGPQITAGPTPSIEPTVAPEPTPGPGPQTTPVPTKSPEPETSATPVPGPSLTVNEQTQLKPRDPIYTEDGELLFLSVEAPGDWMFCAGDVYDPRIVTVRAVFRQNGQQVEKILSYGGPEGYSIVFSTGVPGNHMAIFLYRGMTATAQYHVLSSHASIRYYAEAEGKIYASALFPGLVNALVAEEDAAQREELEKMKTVVYATSGSVIDLTKYHRWMIAYLGDEQIRQVFADSSDTNYKSVTFLKTDDEGYLTNMLGGFQYCLSSELQQDGGPYLFYPASAEWGQASRTLVNVVQAVPEGYKIRRETSGSTEDLPEYTGEQILEKYTGTDPVIETPMGVTKIDLQEAVGGEQVTELWIPESVREINTLSVASCLPHLKAYTYTGASGQNGLKVVNGVLYSADGKTLLSVPPGMTEMPEWSSDVTAIAAGAFRESQIRELTVPATVNDFAPGCFADFHGETIHITGTAAPKPGMAADTGYKGIMLLPESQYDTVLKDWMFAFADEEITFGTEEGPAAVYRYDKERQIIVYQREPSTLAGIPSGTLGMYQVPEGITAVGAGAFASCGRLHDIELPESVERLEADSLILPDGIESLNIQGSAVVEVDPQVFGDPEGGARVPELAVYVPESLYDACLTAWRAALDPVYGEGTAEKLLQSGSGGFFYEDGAKYQTIPGTADNCRLLRLYDPSCVSFLVRENTTQIAPEAFAGMEALEIVSLPESVTEVGTDAFAGCRSLQTVAVGTKRPGLSDRDLTAESGAENVRVYEAGDDYREFSYGENGEIYGLSYDGAGTLLDVPTDYEGIFSLRENTVSLNEEAFLNCTKLTGLTGENSALAAIGDACFENCLALQKVDLSAFTQLKTVGSDLFRACAGLEELILPDGLAAAGAGMCYGCTSLEGFHAAGLQEIGDEAFAYCSRIRTMDIEGVTRLGARAFIGCAAITQMVLPENLEEMGEECFRDCTSLQEIQLNGVLTAISRYAFAGCRNLVSVRMSGSQEEVLKVIGVQAFTDCDSLENADFGECSALQQMGEETFSGCGYLTRVTLPPTLEALPDRCFADCGFLSILELLPESAPKLGQRVFGETVSPYLHLWVRDVSMEAYRQAYEDLLDQGYGIGTTEKILGVIDPQKEYIRGVTYLMTDEGRVLLEADPIVEGELTVFQDTVRIADEAFRDCTLLTAIELPDGSNIALGDRCFQGCSALKEVRLYGDIPQWGEDTFRDCASICKVELGNRTSDRIARIGDRAFAGCTGLVGTTAASAVSFVAQITSLGTACFSGCSEMAVVTVTAEFQAYLEQIEDRAFEGCRSLGVLLNSNYVGLRSIGAYAFTECDALRMPSIPAGVTSIGEGCFAECDNLQYVSFYCGLEEYPKDCFRNCPKLIRTGGTADAFQALRRIGEGAYEGCSSLQMPLNPEGSTWHLGRYENLEEIGRNAFRGCAGIVLARVPKTVKKIEAGAFAACGNLQTLEFLSLDPPQIEAGALDETDGLSEILVPQGDGVYPAYLERLALALGEERAKALLVLPEEEQGADPEIEQNTERVEVEK